MSVDQDAWTCPVCQETVRGDRRKLRAAQADHSKDHSKDHQGARRG